MFMKRANNLHFCLFYVFFKIFIYIDTRVIQKVKAKYI